MALITQIKLSLNMQRRTSFASAISFRSLIPELELKIS